MRFINLPLVVLGLLLRDDDRHRYHGMTFGHLAGELIRRVSGKTLVEFLIENILEPVRTTLFQQLTLHFSDCFSESPWR